MTPHILIQRKAAKMAGYDVKHPPDELEFNRLKKLLVDGVGDDGLLIEQFIDDVKDGLLMPSRKTGKGFNWPNQVGNMTQIIKTKPLSDDELLTVEAGGYPGVVITPWHSEGGAYPNEILIARVRTMFDDYDFEDELNKQRRRHRPPAAKIEYYFSRLAIGEWLAAIGLDANPVLAAWIGSGSELPAKPGKRQSAPRQTNLKKVILQACKHYERKPSFAELVKYIEDDLDDTGTIHDWTDDKVTWMTTKGELRDTSYKALKNMLSRIKYH